MINAPACRAALWGNPGDLNKNDLLESNEAWSFTCQSNLTQTTTNTGIASGEANGLVATDFALATVVVAVPKLPSTGFEGKNTLWGIMALTGILMVVSVSYAVALKKRKI